MMQNIEKPDLYRVKTKKKESWKYELCKTRKLERIQIKTITEKGVEFGVFIKRGVKKGGVKMRVGVEKIVGVEIENLLKN